jgi:hypothetical protein
MPCDATQSPRTEGCLVTDEYGVFVSAAGDDTAAGTKDAPLKTITKAVEVAAASDKAVLVCTAIYDEHVVITAGARIYGGFSCTDWSADATGRPLVKPQTSSEALKIDSVTDAVLIEGMSFEVGDAVAAGETALTAIVNESPNVTLRAVSLKAGKGKAGANGTLTPFTFPSAESLNGNAEGPAGMGGGEKTCNCQAGLMSVGGGGGPPSSTGQAGAKGGPDHGGGAAGQPGSCVPSGGGGDGNNAPPTSTASGALLLGSVVAGAWSPASGADGATGSPGQGGGGGASRNSSGHGGGGGCGSCGGNGGPGGQGGGGSIALLILESGVVIESTVLATADAGNGGGGAAGQAGQAKAGSGGNSLDNANSCGGGVGGLGAAGAAGGGGAGGISIGVLWKGTTEPVLSVDTTVTNGKAGAKGIGGVPGTNDGVVGVAQKVRKVD